MHYVVVISIAVLQKWVWIIMCRHDIVLLGLELSTAEEKRHQLSLCRSLFHEISVSHKDARFTFHAASLIQPQ